MSDHREAPRCTAPRRPAPFCTSPHLASPHLALSSCSQGMILRRQLLVLLQERVWEKQQSGGDDSISTETQRRFFSSFFSRLTLVCTRPLEPSARGPAPRHAAAAARRTPDGCARPLRAVDRPTPR